MQSRWRKILIALSTSAALGFGAALAQADGYGRHGPSHGYGHGHSYGHRHYGHGRGWGYPYYGRGYVPRYGWPGYAWPGYGYGYGYGYGPRVGLGYSSFGHHDSWGVALSLPLYFGSRYPSYEPDRSYIPAPHTHAPARAAAAPADAACLQTREYQTEITIGDEVMPAYGMACLQADGSWKVVSGPIVADD